MIKGISHKLILLLSGKKTTVNYGSLGEHYCNKCERTEIWQLLQVKIRLLVFSFPLIPYKKKYWAVCQHCGYAQVMTGKNLGLGKIGVDDSLNARDLSAQSDKDRHRYHLSRTT